MTASSAARLPWMSYRTASRDCAMSRRLMLRRHLLARRRPLQLRDVELLHPHHRVHRAVRLLAVGIGQQPRQRRRRDLPREAEAILEPAARSLFAAVGEGVPELVDLLL